MLLLGDGPGGQRKESHCAAETTALLSGSSEMMAGPSREGRAQLPDPGIGEWSREGRGPQGWVPREESLWGPKFFLPSALEEAGWVPFPCMKRMLQLPSQLLRKLCLVRVYTPRSQCGQEGGERVGQWAGGFRRGKAHPLLERPAGDHKDKCASCTGLSDTLEAGLVWGRLEAGRTAHRGQTSLEEKMVASSRGGTGDRAG